MMTETAGGEPHPDGDETAQLLTPLKRLDMGGKMRVERPSENLALLNAARARLRGGGHSTAGVAAVCGPGGRFSGLKGFASTWARARVHSSSRSIGFLPW